MCPFFKAADRPFDGRAGDDMNDVEIAQLDARPNGDRVRLRHVVLNGRSLVDIRLFFRGEGGLYVPTTKGIALQVGELWNFSDAIAKAISLVSKVRK